MLHDFVPGTKFFIPVVESLITPGNRWAEINLDSVWGGEGDREAAEKEEELNQG